MEMLLCLPSIKMEGGGGHDIVLKINTKVVKLQCFLEKDFRLGKGMGGGG